MFHYQKGELATLGKDANEKKVVEVKNLRGKMDNLKQEDFKRILANLTAQNQKLKEEYTNLNNKVSQLIEKRKIQKRQANHHLQSQIQQAKKALQQQYKVVDHYKKEVQRQNQGRLEEKLIDKYNTYMNAEAEINAERTQLLKEKKTLETHIEQNTQMVKEYTDDSPYDVAEYEKVMNQNKEMRRKLQASKKTLTVKEKESQEVLDKLLSLKLEHRKRLSIQPASSDLIPQPSRRKENALEITILQKEVEELKSKKSQLQTQVQKEKSEYDQKRAKIEKKIRQNLEIQKTLARQKTKISNTLNMYESVERQAKDAAFKAEQPVVEVTQQKGIQTETPVVYSFRRDWVGKLGKLQCDDGKILEKSRQLTFVKSMVVYMQGQVITAIKFTYHLLGSTFVTQLPIDDEYLKKLTAKTFEAEDDSYLHTFKVGIKQNQIHKIQVTSNIGAKSSFGTSPQGIILYSLDIQQKQRPLCMFQSFHFSKDKYTLQALGCQILDL